MAAVARSRPTFTAPKCPSDSGLKCLTTLASTLTSSTMKPTLIEMGHALIRTATTMAELGYTGGSPRELTLAVKALDEGLYAHLLNKAAKLIISSHCVADPLGLMDDQCHWLIPAVWPTDADGNALLDGGLYWASKNYANAASGLYE